MSVNSEFSPQTRERIRVLHVIAALQGGGAENFVAQLVPRIDMERFRSAVLTVYPSEIPETIAASGTHVIQMQRRGRYDWHLPRRIIEAVRGFRPHVVHTHMHNGKYWGRFAARVAGVPVIIHTEHNPVEEDRGRTEMLIDRVLAACTTRFVTFTREQRAVLARRERVRPGAIEVIANGIIHSPLPTPADRVAARCALEIPDDCFAVFMPARLQQRKNQQLAIEAMARLSGEIRAHARLYIIGGGPDEGRLRELAAVAGVSDFVRFTGFRPDAKKLLPGADAVLMTSLQEGMPLALLEAMSAGVPVITTPWLGASELLDGGRLGRVLPDWEPQSIVRALHTAVECPGMLNASAQEAMSVARSRYDISVTVREHERLYRRLLAERKPGAPTARVRQTV